MKRVKTRDLQPEFLSEMGCFFTRVKKKAVFTQLQTTSEVDLGEKLPLVGTEA